MTEDQINHMVNRFLGWRLPENFNPDCGISATRPNYGPGVEWTPSGTNLFDASQADAMVRHMIEGMSSWRPIETAPRNETVLVAGGDAIYPVTASWDGGHDEGESWHVDGQEDVHCEIGWPTHWMPLPEPPTT